MKNNNAVCSRGLPGFFLAVLLAAFGLAACSSGGGFTSSTNPNSPSNPNTTITTYTITASAGSGGSVTPSGVTTVTQGASQSYTITPNGGYAIATLVIDGTTIATSSTHTFTNVQANHTISATFSAAAPGGIVLSLVPARTSGVAPLAVFFDASATTDIGVTTRPFHDLEYTWSFGDPGSGIWANGARPGVSSKNSATGPVAAHVFETPGTYTVSLTAFDGTNSATTTTTITVQDPDAVFAGTNTICVGATALPTAGVNGCPAGAITTSTNNFAAAINTYQATNKRILFQRGDTFSAPTSAAITSTGPGILGAFGTGDKPYISMPVIGAWATAIKFFAGDWRVMDLALDATGSVDQYGFSVVSAQQQITILRVTATNLGHDADFAGTDQLAIVDSDFSLGQVGSGSSYGLYCGTCTNVMLLGNSMYLNVTLTSHDIRLQGAVKFVVSNNTLTGGLNFDPITVRGNSSYGVESDNKFIDNIVTINPQNATSNEAQHDIIIERNWFVAGPNSSGVLGILAVGITVRNNIFNMTGAAIARAINVGYNNTAGAPMPDLINIYNNTVYTTDAGPIWGGWDIANYQATLTSSCHSDLKNNIGYFPNAYSPKLLINYGGCVITGGSGTYGNSSDTQIKSTFPGWISDTPAVPADFGLTAGSYANNTGASVPVWSDFFRTSRPQNGVIDVGAVEGH